jgi:hypothetical protein
LELLYRVDHSQAAQDAGLDGVYLLMAGGPAASLGDASLLQEWKGQYKVEHSAILNMAPRLTAVPL